MFKALSSPFAHGREKNGWLVVVGFQSSNQLAS